FYVKDRAAPYIYTLSLHDALPISGVICGTEETVNKAWKKLLSLGGALAPFDAWLLLRGLRTLSLRVNQINANALMLAQWLENHPDRKSTRLNSSHVKISYAVFCLK